MLTETEDVNKFPSRDFYPYRLLAGALCAIAVYVAAAALPFAPNAESHPARMAAAITALTAFCWLGNVIPLPAASLLPLALMPICGVMPVKQAATGYTHPIIWMFFGGFVLALGIERWGLHRRLALGILRRVGVAPSKLVFGFMAASAVLSMWLNNTSTTLMLLPIALALIESLAQAGAIRGQGETNFAFALLLGIAYACSIGGMGTPVGTAPNALFLAQYWPFERQGAPPMTFLDWTLIGVPVVACMIPLTWLWLTKILAPLGEEIPQAKAAIDRETRSLASMDVAETRMAILAGLAALLWMTRRDVSLGGLGTIPGWWHLFPVDNAQYIGDAAVAVFVAVLSFVVPAGRRPGQALMNWHTAKELPWDVLLLIGGGISIANAFTATGLAESLGLLLRPLTAILSPFGMLVLVCTMVTFLTEVTSNTAMSALLLPILASMSVGAGQDPRLLMLGATFSASCAFMLPIATPPNAIMFSSGRIPMQRMARAGFFINLTGVVVIAIIVWFVGGPILHVDPHHRPHWLTKE